MNVVVVGAGVFGLTTALELGRRGHRVAVVDRGPIPNPDASSTDISKAVRMDYGSDEAYMALMEEALLGWDAWNREWGEDLYHEDGILFLSRDPMRPRGFEYESHALLLKRGHDPERMDRERLARRFPAWRAEGFADGYFNPRGGWAESGKVVTRLLPKARAAGVEILEGVRCAQILEVGSRVVGIVTDDGRTLSADSVVVAAGAWTPTLVPQLADVLVAVAQPVLHFRPADPSSFFPRHFPVWGADIARTGWYGFPANADGIVKVANHGAGTRVHPDAPRRRLPDGFEERCRAFLKDALPGLASAPLAGSRICLYEDSLDGDFWIGRDPERPGLVVASGGSGHGFKFAPVLGGLVADVVLGRPNPAAERFRWRRPARHHTEEARHHDLS